MDVQNIEQHITDIRVILDKNLPETFWKEVSKRKTLGSVSLKIAMAPTGYLINGIESQRPQVVSLALWYEHKELSPQAYGCCGGQSFLVHPDPEGPEKHYAYSSVKVPFRKPKWNEKAVYGAVERFCQKYVQLLRENADRLPHKQHGDYSFLNE